MTIKDHGHWVQYIPAKTEAYMPPGTLFLKRESDGQDWYEYVNLIDVTTGDPLPGRVLQFSPHTVKCVVEPKGRGGVDGEPSGPIVRVAAVDAARMFPINGQLLELEDVSRLQDEAALIEEFVNREIDLKTGKLGPKWEPKFPEPKIDDRIADALEMILKRLEKLEGK
jgi:hypothetical protein